MSEKYCDHGLYGAAVVTGNTTSANATLTVTAVTSGRLGLGTMITGTSIPANTYISALVAGGGTGGAEGTGQYTMSANATATATGTTVTAAMGGPSLVPAWGVAQEGDGTAIGAATPATVSIDMTSWTFSTSSTVSIMGATAITCTASATTSAESATPNAQYSATLTTMIDNLVTAINWHIANAVNIPSGWTAHKIRNTVFARRNGNSLELMTRAGSAGWNTLVAATFASVTGSSSQSWASGAGGAWGYLANVNTSIWPSGIALSGYGIWCATQPVAGVQIAGDVVNLRAGKLIISASGNPVPMMPPGLTADPNLPIVHLVDDSTIWSDGANPTLILRYTSAATQTLSLDFRNTMAIHLIGKRYAADTYNLRFEASGASACYVGIYLCSNSLVENFHCEAMVVSSTRTFIAGSAQTHVTGRRATFRNGVVKHSTTAAFITGLGGNNNVAAVDFYNIVLDNSGATVLHNGAIDVTNTQSEDTFYGLRCLNFVIASKLCYGTATNTRVTFVNPQLGNISSRGPSANAASCLDHSSCIAIFNQSGERDFSIDNVRGMVVWNSTRAQPTLNAVLPNGTTPWSWLVAPNSTALRVTAGEPLRSPRIAKINSLASGARTFTLEFCLSDQITNWTKRDVSVQIMYTDTSGNNVILDTWDRNAGALTTSGATWSAESAGKVTYSDGGTLYHNKYKFVLSTPSGNELPLGEEVGIYFRVHNTVADASKYLFVDPDVSIA